MKEEYNPDNSVNVVKVAVISLLCLMGVWAVFHMFTLVHAGESIVIQTPGGSLYTIAEPGYKLTWFGKVTRYKRSFQYWFSTAKDQGEARDQSIKVRFNDGGHANLSGSVRVDMPVDSSALLDIHRVFGTQDAVEQQLIRTCMEKSVYMTGPLMSSKESYAEKRTDLINFIEDQAIKGVYQTVSKDVETKDPISGEKKHVTVVEVRRAEAGGLALRQEDSPLIRFNVKLYNLSLNEVKYDDVVEKQIQQQQEATMSVQTAMANAKKAEQDAMTVAKQGEANAMKIKWEQESINAKVVAEADGRARAAELDKKAAEYKKATEILLGEGESKRKQLMMEANGALDPKLDAYIKVNELWAAAFAKMTQPLVPSVVMGNSSGGGSTQDLIDLIKVKTAKELGLDMSVETGKRK